LTRIDTLNENPFLNNSGIKNSKFKFNRAVVNKKCEICNINVKYGLEGEN